MDSKEREFITISVRPTASVGLAILCFLCITLTFLPKRASSQWKSILTSPYDGDFLFIYFLDQVGHPEIGFAGLEGTLGIDTGILYRTSDGGKTWTEATVTPGKWMFFDMMFKDSLTGWMVAGGGGGKYFGGCFKTTDGGLTWSFLPQSSTQQLANDPGSIYYDSLTDGIFTASTSGNWQLVSWDEGNTWSKSISIGYGSFGYSFASENDGTLEDYLKTTDGGRTWSFIEGCDSVFMQSVAIPNTQTYIAVTYWGYVLRTDDAWSTYQIISQIPAFDFPGPHSFRATGCIRCLFQDCDSGKLQYLIAQSGLGCFISRDTGKSWESLNGPTETWYSWGSGGTERFYVAGSRIYVQTVNIDAPGARTQIWSLNLDSVNPVLIGVSSGINVGSQQTSLHPGDSVGVTFIPGAGNLAATDSVTLSLHYDPNAVSLSSLQVPAGWWISDSSVTTPPPTERSGEGGSWGVVTVTLRSDSAQSLPDPLLHAEFQTYLTPSEDHPLPPSSKGGGIATFIYLDSARSYFPQTTPCAPTVLSLQQPDSVELDFTGCGDSTLLAAMEHQPPFSIESVVPNPAGASLRVQGIGYRVQGLEVQLFDALGNCVLTEYNAIPYTLSPTPYTLPLDVSSLPSGIYFLRLSSGGYAMSRSVAIER